MVSRIESDGGNLNWHFAKNVLPGEEVRFVDLDPNKSCRMFSVVCMKDDSRTCIYQVEDEHFLDTGQSGENPVYTEISILRLGDPFFITDVYSPYLEHNIKVRVSHQYKI